MTRRVTIESWDPEYRSPLEGGDPSEVSSDEVDTTVEVSGPWEPISAPADAPVPKKVGFVDGVRRVDARLWIEEGHDLAQGICASYAAGLVVSDLATSSAKVVRAAVRRSMFCPIGAPGIETRHGVFEHVPVASDDPDRLSLGLQAEMGSLEIELSRELGTDADLVVIDGPLRFKDHLPTAVGYVKTHRTTYLRNGELATIGRLQVGQRTPLFLTSSGWTRYSWYLRLPIEVTHSWAGVVRCEAAIGGGLEGAVAMADLTAATLGRFASTPHKDPRAPQNLFPIAGLERRLRHLLGDAPLLLRALRSATRV